MDTIMTMAQWIMKAVRESMKTRMMMATKHSGIM